MTTRQIERISAMDVQDGDIVFKMGYRCRASNCRTDIVNGVPTRTYRLTSEPDALNTDTLPGGFNGGHYGGNAWATEGRETVPHNAE
jgi:hypothetical protein